MNDFSLTKAFELFDAYNGKDPVIELVNLREMPRALAYGWRMTECLTWYDPAASIPLQLAARCQHIGRWEIARSNYSMDKKGYLQWRHAEKVHQCNVASMILEDCNFPVAVIEKVKFLLMKRELQTNSETQILEDVICLVFVQFYLQDFAAKHTNEKVVDILVKTIKKMTPRALDQVGKIELSPAIRALIARAV